MLANFISLLHDRGRLGLLPSISEAYQALSDQAQGLLRGTLSSAVPLEDRDLASIEEALGIFTGRKVLLSQKLDPSILAGLVARIGDLVVDGSLRTQLARLSALVSQA
jgi:F-type H+-transporting ATPase subunit delta